MTNQLMVFFSIGFALLLFLLLLWRSAATETKHLPADYRLGVDAGLPPRAVAERLFDIADLSFVSQHAPDVRRIFVQDRRVIALSWLERIRNAVRTLFRSHLRSARQRSDIGLATEIGVLLHFAAFFFLWDVLFFLIWLRGPFCVVNLVRHTNSLLEWLSSNVKTVPVLDAQGELA